MGINDFYNSDKDIMIIIITKDNKYIEVNENKKDMHMDLIKKAYKSVSLEQYTKLCLFSNWYDIYERVPKDGYILIKLTNMQDIYQIVYLPDELNDYQLTCLKEIYNNNYRKYYYLDILEKEIDLTEYLDNIDNDDGLNIRRVLNKKIK